MDCLNLGQSVLALQAGDQLGPPLRRTGGRIAFDSATFPAPKHARPLGKLLDVLGRQLDLRAKNLRIDLR